MARGARGAPQPQTRIALQTGNMQAVGPATEQLCVQLHIDLREKTTACIESGGKTRRSQPKTKAAASTG
jgi:hypothetical protein